MSAKVGINFDALSKSMGAEAIYVSTTLKASNFNSRLAADRRARQPYIDAQTGLAQSHTNLFHLKYERSPGTAHGQLYTYPSKSWIKRKRLSFFGTQAKIEEANVLETGEADMHQISSVENPNARTTRSQNGTGPDQEPDYSLGLDSETSKDQWYYEEYEDLSEPPDAGEIDDRLSDDSDYGASSKKKKKKHPGGRPRKKAVDKESTPEEKDKPFPCEVCSARYKTRPGLSYHYRHFHTGLDEADDSQSAQRAASPTPPASEEEGKDGDKEGGTSSYCDFCLGDADENKKTQAPEELVSCSDCGRSGHPTCLQFTPNMIVSVKKYPWQCIECKSCGLCGTSDNDDQLLFCDDCDRGYHMYCLTPPLLEPPEGNWSCHLCIEEFHGGRKPKGMQ